MNTLQSDGYFLQQLYKVKVTNVLFTELKVMQCNVTSSKIFHPIESCPLSPLLKKVNEVLTEVVYLIERLEADRQYAEEALHKEKQRRGLLESKTDSIALWKQNEHSHVVQKGQ